MNPTIQTLLAEVAELNTRHEYLLQAISDTADRRSEVIRLLQREGLTYREIANHLGVSVKAVAKSAARTPSRVPIGVLRGYRSHQGGNNGIDDVR